MRYPMNVTGNLKTSRIIEGKRFFAWVLTLIALCFGCQITPGQITNPQPATPSASTQQGSSAQSSTEQSPAHKYFTDVVLVNQNGEKMRFYSDLLKGKVVIINS